VTPAVSNAPKRILFVTHALESMYGAGTSLRLLLKNYPDIEADILLPRSFRNPRNLTALAAQFPGVRRAYELSLPVNLSILGIKRGFADVMHGMAHGLAWQRDRGHYLQLLRENRYDLVHFNSPILHRMVMPGIPAVTHMRDILRDPASPVVDKLANGRGIIFIDTATRQPFARREGHMRTITLNNPIDMTAVSNTRPLQHPKIGAATTVFSMIGRISELKGVALVINAFRQGAGPDARLLIVGDGPSDYVAHCHAIAADDPRIVFWGEESNIAKIYAATDYVVRGDPQPCVGRTVYEGLYAGCRVMMPGPGSPDLIFEAERFLDSIFWYAPGSKAALATMFTACSSNKVGARRYLSNIEAYVTAFDTFMNACLERKARSP
jgi:glycosyltransferase involved in cell wall biosynthesis